MPAMLVSDMTLFCRQLEAKAKQQRLEDRKEVCAWPLVPNSTLLDQQCASLHPQLLPCCGSKSSAQSHSRRQRCTHGMRPQGITMYVRAWPCHT